MSAKSLPTAVLDANCVVNALEAERAGRASEDRALVVFVVDEGVRLATSPRTRDEYKFAMQERGIDSASIRGVDLLRLVIDPMRSVVVAAAERPVVNSCKDPADNWVLDAAVRGKADVLATNDRALLDVSDRFRFSILKPDRARGLLTVLCRLAKQTISSPA